MPVAAVDHELELAEEVASYYADPLGFVLAMYPWGEPGPLVNHDGPDAWQREMLEEIGAAVRERAFDGSKPVAPIRRAVSSGHGIGKSTIVAWLVDWIMSTRPYCQGSITANTFTQLETKSWAAVKRWTALCLTAHWFVVSDKRMYHKDFKDSWFCAPQSSKEENSEAFAGQHAENSTSFYVFDEDSGICDLIHEVAEGGLTDGEPMIFLFGNPTKNSGNFYRSCFGADKARWSPKIIDSRECKFTNKELIQEWIDLYGENSDFVRVRVRGLPPSASDIQFIDSDCVFEAQRREVSTFPDEPLLAGFDVARGGMDDCCLRFRRGADARSIPAIRFRGEESRDTMRVATVLTEALERDYDGHRIHTLFVDATGGSVGGPLVDRLRMLGHKNVIGVQFGSKSPDAKLANMRAYMWDQMRTWLRSHGCIDSLPDLETDLTGPGYHHDKHDRLCLESKEDMKKRGLDSPDDGDALALTFAAKVSPAAAKRTMPAPLPTEWGWT